MSGTARAWRRRRQQQHRARVLVLADSPDSAAWRQGNYVPALLALQPRIEAMGPGIYHVDCYHDPWCSIYKGGRCDCQPDVRLRGDPRDN